MKNINDPLVANLLVPDNLKEEVWRLRKENETLLQEVQVRQKCCVFHLNKKKCQNLHYKRFLKTGLLLDFSLSRNIL